MHIMYVVCSMYDMRKNYASAINVAFGTNLAWRLCVNCSKISREVRRWESFVWDGFNTRTF